MEIFEMLMMNLLGVVEILMDWSMFLFDPLFQKIFNVSAHEVLNKPLIELVKEFNVHDYLLVGFYFRLILGGFNKTMSLIGRQIKTFPIGTIFNPKKLGIEKVKNLSSKTTKVDQKQEKPSLTIKNI